MMIALLLLLLLCHSMTSSVSAITCDRPDPSAPKTSPDDCHFCFSMSAWSAEPENQEVVGVFLQQNFEGHRCSKTHLKFNLSTPEFLNASNNRESLDRFPEEDRYAPRSICETVGCSRVLLPDAVEVDVCCCNSKDNCHHPQINPSFDTITSCYDLRPPSPSEQIVIESHPTPCNNANNKMVGPAPIRVIPSEMQRQAYCIQIVPHYGLAINDNSYVALFKHFEILQPGNPMHYETAVLKKTCLASSTIKFFMNDSLDICHNMSIDASDGWVCRHDFIFDHKHDKNVLHTPKVSFCCCRGRGCNKVQPRSEVTRCLAHPHMTSVKVDQNTMKYQTEYKFKQLNSERDINEDFSTTRYWPRRRHYCISTYLKMGRRAPPNIAAAYKNTSCLNKQISDHGLMYFHKNTIELYENVCEDMGLDVLHKPIACVHDAAALGLQLQTNSSVITTSLVDICCCIGYSCNVNHNNDGVSNCHWLENEQPKAMAEDPRLEPSDPITTTTNNDGCFDLVPWFGKELPSGLGEDTVLCSDKKMSGSKCGMSVREYCEVLNPTGLDSWMCDTAYSKDSGTRMEVCCCRGRDCAKFSADVQRTMCMNNPNADPSDPPEPNEPDCTYTMSAIDSFVGDPFNPTERRPLFMESHYQDPSAHSIYQNRRPLNATETDVQNEWESDRMSPKSAYCVSVKPHWVSDLTTVAHQILKIGRCDRTINITDYIDPLDACSTMMPRTPLARTGPERNDHLYMIMEGGFQHFQVNVMCCRGMMCNAEDVDPEVSAVRGSWTQALTIEHIGNRLDAYLASNVVVTPAAESVPVTSEISTAGDATKTTDATSIETSAASTGST